MAGVLVFGDTVGGRLAPASLGMAAAGAALAQALNEPLLGALMGDAPAAAAGEFNGGFAVLHLLAGQHLLPYTAAAAIGAARAAIDACQPSVVQFPHTLETREWVPRLAAMSSAAVKVAPRTLSTNAVDCA